MSQIAVTKTEKPHKGRIDNWMRLPWPSEQGVGYMVLGKFLDHPTVGKHGGFSHTSLVLKHDLETGGIETLNSRYTLINKERT